MQVNSSNYAHKTLMILSLFTITIFLPVVEDYIGNQKTNSVETTQEHMVVVSYKNTTYKTTIYYLVACRLRRNVSKREL